MLIASQIKLSTDSRGVFRYLAKLFLGFTLPRQAVSRLRSSCSYRCPCTCSYCRPVQADPQQSDHNLLQMQRPQEDL